jgi:molybdenum cofactor guanylyltransferase/molybdopterin-guanine dinucleotide biosynthesis protein MobB
VLGFAAWSGTGKTTLLTKLIPWLRTRDLRVALIKHAHHDFDIDHPGKDSYALRQAGAGQVLIASRRRHAWMMEYEQDAEPALETLVSRLDASQLDLVLVEGFRHARFPKIELHRAALGRPLLFPGDDSIVAVASAAPLPVAAPIPVLDLNDVPAIGNFVLERLGLTSRCRSRNIIANMDPLPTLGLILAGGRSRRMGTDKAFVPLAGRPLLAHVIDRLAPQVDELVISSNAPAANFAAYGAPVLPDVLDGFHGPLAGVHAALARSPGAAVVSVAVDLPLLPRDLVARLKAGWNGAHCRYAVCGGRHALAILWPPGFADMLWNRLVQGRRGVWDWLEQHGEPIPVSPGNEADLRLNINTPADLAQAEGLVAQQGR